MSNWKYKLDLKDLISDYEADKLTVEELGQKVAERIREQPYYEDEQFHLESIARNFEECCNTVDDFDYCINELYDWGDITLPTPKKQLPIFNKMAWIATKF
jgi:hypothetical protein